MLVTLEEAKAHLRYDDDADDVYITGLIEAADAVIKKHIDDADYDEQNKALQRAALQLIGYYDRRRNAEVADSNGWFLPAPVLALLTPYRTPTAG